MPLTSPDVFTVDTPVLLLLHVPPVVVEDNEVVAPVQTVRMPDILAGVALTVTIVVLAHPDRE
jgi:hypothetical protein